MSNKKKRPKKAKPDKGKRIQYRPSADDDINYNTKKPIFSLGKMVSGYSVEDCEKDEKAAFAMALYKLSKLTWAELCSAPHDGLGYEKIKFLKVKTPLCVKEDTTIIAFRFYGKKTMIGFRIRQVFNILYLDRDFSVYKHS